MVRKGHVQTCGQDRSTPPLGSRCRLCNQRTPTTARILDLILHGSKQKLFETRTYSDYCREASALLLVLWRRPERWVENRSLLSDSESFGVLGHSPIGEAIRTQEAGGLGAVTNV